ncbi:MAG: UDP-N-acetylmuramoylalanine--D-glutamate ligase [Acidobacteriota bacterium]
MTAVFDPARVRRAFVLGLGLSGGAAARLLRSRGVEIVACDRRRADELELEGLAGATGVELVTGGEPAALPPGIDVVVASPGVAPGHPLLAAARAAGVPVVAEVELAFAWLDGTVVAITGSNGKSTTTAMTGHLLAAAGFAVEVCGNIGVPLAAVVDGPPGRTFVVELSSFQLETIDRFRPRAAALLNLSPDHLDRHGDLAGYLAAKRRIFANQGGSDTAVLNADEPEVAATPVASRRRLFSRLTAVDDGCALAGETVVERAPGAPDAALFAVADVPLPGPHNVENAMAAALLARAVGAPAGGLGAALRSFRGLPHRLERFAERAGVAWYDDSKGTNVAATARSLEGFADGSVHVVLGGRNKGADFRWLRDVVARKVRHAYLIGESAADLERALAGTTGLERSGTLEAAVAAAAGRARAGEVVVLSPACASFDQFRDYRDRGRQFQRLVALLAAAPGGRGGADGQEARV